ncbi:MAG TPA: prepilin peptidase [Novosphingobium sp.]|nr:prepilin peptidase [Novosphingobium sp.]
MSLTGAVLLATFAAIAVCGLWLDVRYRLLPNWLALLAAATGLAAAAWTGGPSALGLAAAHGFLALAAGLGLFALRWIGGGDAKFYAGIACWFPLWQGLFLLVSVSLVGLLLSLGMLLVLRRRPRRGGLPQPDERSDAFRQVPFGVAIALGGLFALSMQGGMP